MTTDSSTYTLGLDLGNKTHALCALNSDGEVIHQSTLKKKSVHSLTTETPWLSELCVR